MTIKQLETYIINNNSYHIYNVQRDNDKISISLTWGKTDFRTELHRQNSHQQGTWETTSLSILKNLTFYAYVKVSEHGIVFEETLWKTEDDKEIFIELPKDFKSTIGEVSSLVLQKRGW